MKPLLGDGFRKPADRQRIWICVVLAVVTFAVFAPVLTYPFVIYDDPTYIRENPRVTGGVTARGMAWALTATWAANWHPLTWLSHMLDVQVFGLNPSGHHLTNLLLHILNAVMLFAVLDRATGNPLPSAFTAFLFALHPLHVESVAWVAERKDVLCAFFWMLTLWWYAAYARKPGRAAYGKTLAAFILALLSKPMAVTLPFVLLLLDVWPFSRIPTHQGAGFALSGLGKSLIEKVPFFALSAISCVITLYAQAGGGAVRSLDTVSLGLRLANAVVAYAEYLKRAIWPAGLSVMYPIAHQIPPARWVPALALIAGLSVLAVLALRRRPYATVGWLWYLGTLVPVIGLVQVGSQAMADRYSYLPLIGVFAAAAWGLWELGAGYPAARTRLWVAAAVAVAVFSAVSARQVRFWQDSVTLFTRAVQVTRDNYVAHNNLGLALAESGEIDKAIHHYRQSLAAKPDYIKALNNLGNALAEKNRMAEAKAAYRRAIEVHPGYARARFNLANVLMAEGSRDAAIDEYRKAHELNPEDAAICLELGNALMGAGNAAEAIGYYRAGLDADPANADIHEHVALAHWVLGDMRMAEAFFVKALELDPESADAHNNYGYFIAGQGRQAQAVRWFQQALTLDPGHKKAIRNLKDALDATQAPQSRLESLPRGARQGPADADPHLRPAKPGQRGAVPAD